MDAKSWIAEVSVVLISVLKPNSDYVSSALCSLISPLTLHIFQAENATSYHLQLQSAYASASLYLSK